MAKLILPDAEELRKKLDYDPETGLFVWRKRGPEDFRPSKFSSEVRSRQWNTQFAGKSAFTARTRKGYLFGQLVGTNGDP